MHNKRAENGWSRQDMRERLKAQNTFSLQLFFGPVEKILEAMESFFSLKMEISQLDPVAAAATRECSGVKRSRSKLFERELHISPSVEASSYLFRCLKYTKEFLSLYLASVFVCTQFLSIH